MSGSKMQDAAPVVAGIALLKEAQRAGLVDEEELAGIDDLKTRLGDAAKTPESSDYFYVGGKGVTHRLDLPVSLKVERGSDGVERVVRTGLRVKKTPVYPTGKVVREEPKKRVSNELVGKAALAALKAGLSE